ncbi:uncharacterized protein GGS25DRAFT_473517, partial [Hypoxylon fragiforme]|uniref:uncharacterized protein n=1 Tax=Hypoxylon fragiforme TaxID=63214 RepID=UPI0020C68B16
ISNLFNVGRKTSYSNVLFFSSLFSLLFSTTPTPYVLREITMGYGDAMISIKLNQWPRRHSYWHAYIHTSWSSS